MANPIDRTGYEDKDIRVLGRARRVKRLERTATWWYECKRCHAFGMCHFRTRPHFPRGKVCACLGTRTKLLIPVGANSGFLTAIREGRSGKVVCSCVCGRIVTVTSYCFHNKKARSCGCKRRTLRFSTAAREATCEHCGKTFVAKTKIARFCGLRCGVHHRKNILGPTERTCKVCHRSFLSIRPNHIYCNQRCSKRSQKRKWAERKALQQMFQLNQLLEKTNGG
jgi:hypothetical protein